MSRMFVKQNGTDGLTVFVGEGFAGCTSLRRTIHDFTLM